MTMILVRVFNTGKAEQAYLSEFEVNLVYIVKVCLKLKKKNEKFRYALVFMELQG